MTSRGFTLALLFALLSIPSVPVLPAGAQLRAPGATAEPTGRAAVRRIRIGLDGNPKASSDYERDDWRESIERMRTTGANHLHYAKLWTEVEQQAGVYDTNEVEFMMEQSAPLSVAFNLRVIDAGQRNMPEAYKGLAWDSPQMVGHIVAAVERLAPLLANRVWSYAIGNEIDMYFGSRRNEIAAYGRMLQQVAARVRALHPGVLFTTSFQAAAAGELRTTYAPLLPPLDHVAFNYYPLGEALRVRPPSVAPADIRAMIGAAAPRPIYLQEIGYPTASILGSSPEDQATFVRLAFETIRAEGSSRVLGATYLFQADLPNWLVDVIAQAYGTNAENFRAFIGTLGLRDERDRAKPGWDEFIRQAELIGPPRSAD